MNAGENPSDNADRITAKLTELEELILNMDKMHALTVRITRL